MLIKDIEKVLVATTPRDIFDMNLDTLDAQKDAYLEAFKPAPYRTVKHFMATQKVIQLYRKAMNQLENPMDDTTLELISKDGRKNLTFNVLRSIPLRRLGTMYVCEHSIIFVIDANRKIYYENYIQKTSCFTKLSPEIWDKMRFSLPKVNSHFECADGSFAIIIKKPLKKFYPLREILDYCGGSLDAEIVTSILTRLHYITCYLGIIGINHNAITLDTLFFAPGNFVDDLKKSTENDARAIGLFGGWFFSTFPKEKISGVPREIFELLPKANASGFSSYAIDALSIKRIGRELLGDADGKNYKTKVPSPLREWLSDNTIEKNAYEQFVNFEQIKKISFPTKRFVPLDISIN